MMEFLEMSGAKLLSLLNEDEYQPDELRKAGVTDNAKVRINRQGDIEVFSKGEWEVVGGLLGDFLHRIEERTGIAWKFQN